MRPTLGKMRAAGPLRADYSASMKATPREVPEQWSWHERTLRQIRETLIREREEREAAARASLERGGVDAIDVAREQTDHENLVAEISQEQAELVEVEAALERIRKGTYGVCEATGRPIAPDRLRALPWTRLSVAAAAQREGLK
jgi:RNA polymerase-binding transcription factor DksA